jgi:hypothetical protein
MNGLVHKGSNHFAKNTPPDVCKTPSPGGPVPIPYPVIVSKSSDLANGTTTVKADGGQMIAVKGCEYSMCVGDEAGTAGGVVSSTFKKEAKFILYSFDVKMDGKNACRLSDKMTMNHQNTVCLAGTFPTPAEVKAIEAELRKIAEDCNRDENEKAGHCPSPPGKAPTGEQCKTLGTKKHKCCEKKLEERAKKVPAPQPPMESEVGFSAPGQRVSAAAEKAAREQAAKVYKKYVKAATTHYAKRWGLDPASALVGMMARGAARLGKVWKNAYFKNGGAPFRADVLVGKPPHSAYDFKFSCKATTELTETQIQNYEKYTGLTPKKIHVRGSNC